MRCSKAKGLISPYIDNEISAGERQALESHIGNCAACRSGFEETVKLGRLLGLTERTKAPYGFTTRVMAKAVADKREGTAWVPVFAKFAGTAAVLAMAVLGIISGSFLINGPKNNGMVSSFSLEMFDPAPPGSIGSAYIAMTEAGHEK